MKSWLVGFLLFVMFCSSPAKAANDQMKIFFTSCTYGVLAGTLVGAATLAFTQKPGDNLNNIARGASLGLYGGIILGAYVAYGVPSGDESSEDEEGDGETPEGEAPPEEQTFKPIIFPLFSQNGLDGAALSMQVLSF